MKVSRVQFSQFYENHVQKLIFVLLIGESFVWSIALQIQNISHISSCFYVATKLFTLKTFHVYSNYIPACGLV